MDFACDGYRFYRYATRDAIYAHIARMHMHTCYVTSRCASQTMGAARFVSLVTCLAGFV